MGVEGWVGGKGGCIVGVKSYCTYDISLGSCRSWEWDWNGAPWKGAISN